MNSPKPLGTCVLVFNKQGQLLIVNRPKNPSTYCLPGGKVEHGETNVLGAIRELKEETGIVVNRVNLLEVFRDECSADDDLGVDGYDVTTYLSVCIEENVGTSEEGLTPIYHEDNIKVLMQNHTSPFASYNHRVLTALMPYIELFAEHDKAQAEYWALALDNIKEHLT